MGRREKKAAQEYSSSGEERKKRKSPSDDDAEANEDLSLKIVQKAIQRASRNSPRDNGVSEVVVTDLKEEEKKKKEKRRRKKSTESEAPAFGNGLRDNGVSEVVTDMKEEKEKKKKKKEKRRKKTTETNGVSEVVTDLKEEGKKEEKKRSKKSNGTNGRRDNGVSKEVVTDLKEEKNRKEKRRRKKSNETEVPEVLVSTDIDTGFRDFCGDMVDNVKGKDNLETDKAIEVSVKSVDDEANPVEVPDNTVLKKLLRGPRYFDPPDSNCGACYNCGEEGHTIANCTSAKRKKPCFVCGSLEHNVKQCTKGRVCFICKQQGHRAKDCPEKYSHSKLCLRCGDLGHEMFTCRNDYSPDDIKDMQCYICQKFGHLCCINYSDSGPTEVSCYRCGISGHTGLACMTSYRDNSTNDTPYVASSCYKCGLEGHFARECNSSVKASKRTREPSTPKQRSTKKIKDHTEPYSAPPNLGDSRKEKKPEFEEFASPSKTKQHRGGWTNEYSDDYHYNNQTNSNNWRTPVHSSYNRRDTYGSRNGDYASTSHSSKKPQKINFDNSPASGPSRSYQHRYSASRFSSNYGNDSRVRNNDRW